MSDGERLKDIESARKNVQNRLDSSIPAVEDTPPGPEFEAHYAEIDKRIEEAQRNGASLKTQRQLFQLGLDMERRRKMKIANDKVASLIVDRGVVEQWHADFFATAREHILRIAEKCVGSFPPEYRQVANEVITQECDAVLRTLHHKSTNRIWKDDGIS